MSVCRVGTVLIRLPKTQLSIFSWRQKLREFNLFTTRQLLNWRVTNRGNPHRQVKDRTHTQEGIYAKVAVCDYGWVHWTGNHVTVSCNHPVQSRHKLPVRSAEEWRPRYTISCSLVLTHWQLFNYVWWGQRKLIYEKLAGRYFKENPQRSSQ